MREVRPLQLPVTKKSAPPSWIGADAIYSVQPLFSTTAPDEVVHDTGLAEREAARLLEERVNAAVAQAEAEARARVEAEAQAQWANLLERVEYILTELLDVRRRIFINSEKEMSELAIIVASDILGREIKTEPDYVVRLVKEAVALVADGDEIEISVAPGDYALLADRLNEVSRDNPRAGTLLLKTEDRIEAGCLVETRLARIDATLETRLRNVVENLQAREE